MIQKVDYKNLTVEKIEEALEKIFGKQDPSLTIEKIKEKILNGYRYQIGSGFKDRKILTGKGGVLQYIDACVEMGVPPRIIEDSIMVNTDEQGMVKLSRVQVTKIKNNGTNN